MIIASRRVEITQATLDHWTGRQFAWGSADCARIAREHLKAMGRKVKIGARGGYKTALGARRMLQRMGHVDLAAALDAQLLPRIPLSMVMEGDIIAGEGVEAFHALGIYLGNQAVLGFQDGKAGPLRLEAGADLICWQVVPQ
ncbi:DUF6950 family protein [Sphingobium yanoikuyae]|uniref:DUF6950 family protein n=1 Tax=Sphingobium yanoikuyae TaxID=13690 RepID=UPI000262C431|nr:hypothetical protein [Sphingobium yanoikuyae]